MQVFWRLVIHVGFQDLRLWVPKPACLAMADIDWSSWIRPRLAHVDLILLFLIIIHFSFASFVCSGKIFHWLLPW
jgi:hypothetical protein